MLKDNILPVLLQHPGEWVTGVTLAEQFGVSRMAVSKAVKSLVSEGNDIEAHKSRGYRLLCPGDRLSGGRIARSLRTERFGRSLFILPVTSSTNTAMKELDLRSLPEGHTLFAEEQTGGRGRFGRRFSSPAHAGIYMSVLLKPRLAPGDIPFLTHLAAIAVSRAVHAVAGVSADIKWVNDVYAGPKKLAGILTEGVFTAESGTVEHVVTGIGVNTGEVSPDVRDIATSIQAESGRVGIRNELAAGILNAFEETYFSYLSGEKEVLLAEYRSRLMLLGRGVTVLRGSEGYPATAIDIDGDGGLIVRRTDGTLETLTSGEVSLRLGEGGRA
ncbi:biotin--[acetyl-CoA-carboxylase] ligase [Oscillospiraceae bacterium OttesenSCG-928-G22]|nr:biotin--[acetyl-CoA-carboxylase] ligase [Oscillospiraceae bacterium OttesenSCG-928-G22]